MSKYTDDLQAALNIVNEYEIARRYGCPVIIFHTAHAHAIGYNDHRTTVVVWREAEKRHRAKTLRADSNGRLAESRSANRELAQKWVADHLDYAGEWAPTGLSNSWMPVEAKERMQAELKAWRKEQRAKEEAS